MCEYLLFISREMNFIDVDYENSSNIEDEIIMDHKPSPIEMMYILSNYDKDVFCHVFKVKPSGSNFEFSISDFITTFGGLISNI